MIPQDGAVDFGRRWKNLTRMQLDRSGAGRAHAQLELAPEFHEDVPARSVHPALTDMAATFGLH